MAHSFSAGNGDIPAVVSRDEFARRVAALVESAADGNLTELARQLGVDRKTIRRWLDARNDVLLSHAEAVARLERRVSAW